MKSTSLCLYTCDKMPFYLYADSLMTGIEFSPEANKIKFLRQIAVYNWFTKRGMSLN